MLHQKIVSVVSNLIHERVKKATNKVEDLFKVELAYVNKDNPYFDKEAALKPPLEILNRKTKRVLNDDERKSRAILEILISDFFEIARCRIQDFVPKLIMHWLVNYVAENVREDLTKNIPLMIHLLNEPEDIQYARIEAEKMMQVI